MDKAILGYCRLGYFRLGVYNDAWDKLLEKFQQVSTPKKIIVDGASVKLDEGVYRVDVFTDDFEKLKKRFKL